MIDLLPETPGFKMDPTVSRIMSEAADRQGVSLGYLRRFIDEEASKSHLARRHGIFDNLRELVRHEAARRASQEDPTEP